MALYRLSDPWVLYIDAASEAEARRVYYDTRERILREAIRRGDLVPLPGDAYELPEGTGDEPEEVR